MRVALRLSATSQAAKKPYSARETRTHQATRVTYDHPRSPHFPILNRTEQLELVESEHRDHAVVEQVIADLKDQALAHFPSGQFNANAAWTVLGALAHNLLRWTQQLGLPQTTVRAARTLRRRLLAIPGRLTRHARGWTLHLPARWPWHDDFTAALKHLRTLPAPT